MFKNGRFAVFAAVTASALALALTGCGTGGISADEALSMARQKANIAADDILTYDITMIKNASENYFRVAFTAEDGYEYCYDISESDGSIINSSRDLADGESPAEAENPPAEETAAPEETSAPETDAPDTAAPETQAPATEAPAAAPDSGNTDSYIGEEAAKKAALDHAGVSESDVSMITAKLDRDDGIAVYDVDFYAAGYEYDYEINAVTGEIRSNEKEVDKNYTAPSDTPAAPKTEEYIGEAEAKKIALEHAGVKESDAQWMEVKLDRENRTVVYDVDFDAAGYEYDYEINATTGAVVKSQKEVDDDYRANASSNTNTAPAQTDYIGEAEAKRIAFEHAGINEDDAAWIEVKLDREDRTVVYEIDINAAGYEYDYEINAATGAVVKSQKEVDDDYIAGSQNTAQSDYIGEAEAKRIALEHAGIKESDARKLEAELDREHGRVVYDVSFDSGSYEYDYEIDAVTGTVIKADKERD